MSAKAMQEEPEAKRPAREILRQELREALSSMEGSTGGLCISGLSAGLDLGFSPLLSAIMRSRTTDHFPHAVVEMLAANTYAIGFIFVVLGRTELFTEQTSLAVLPVLNGDVSLKTLGRQWSVVYLSNLAGGAIFAAITVAVLPRLGVVEPQIFGKVAQMELAPADAAMFGSAVFAGWLMGLLSWLVSAARETISQILIVWLITWGIGFAHFHHVMVGGVQMMTGIFAGQGITGADFGRFLLFVTLGNIVGGAVFVALLKYGHTAWANPGALQEGNSK